MGVALLPFFLPPFRPALARRESEEPLPFLLGIPRLPYTLAYVCQTGYYGLRSIERGHACIRAVGQQQQDARAHHRLEQSRHLDDFRVYDLYDKLDELE